MAEKQTSFWRRNRWLMWVMGGLLAGLIVVGAIVTVLAHRAEPFLRARIVEGLAHRFHARVELDSFQLSLGGGLRGPWGVWAEGRGLRIWPRINVPADVDQSPEAQAKAEAAAEQEAGTPYEPLIRLEEFHFHAPLRFERGKPLRISMVRIEGLHIIVPPRKHNADGSGQASGFGAAVLAAPQPRPSASATASNGQPAAAESTTQAAKQGEAKGGDKDAGMLSSVVVERVECNRADLLLETDKPGKLPLGFAIAHLALTGVTVDGPIGFNADLTNPRPLGNIQTTGSFGPWLADDPGDSAVNGDYRFLNADLGGFKDIAGILNSTGHYQGTLRNIVVDGDTDTPDFRLTDFGNPMPLHTHFHARVDGTDGDTWLDPVDATLGSSHFTARGQVVRLKIADDQGQKGETAPGAGAAGAEKASPFRGGHDIALLINVDGARIEDFLRLTGHSATPLLTGAVKVKATLHIPPGPAPVHERLKLNGSFTLDQVQFASTKIQQRIRDLSLRGQGRPNDVKKADPESASSNFNSGMDGDFQMGGGVITLPSLKYTVPGALIQLKGKYEVKGGVLDFAGTAQLQATVSEMVGGWKGLLLKPADRFFKKNGAGTEVPIRISGTREDPQFEVDLGRMKVSKPAMPGEKP